MAILSPFLFLAALEGVLRIFHYGYPTAFFLHRAIGGKPVIGENGKFGWRFFGPELARTPYPTVLPAQKPPGTVRIFVFGESAAYGDPQPDFGLSRMLQAVLEARYPGTKFEVVNAAMVAINSNVILPTARDCARQHGDIWVIYMGNNEVVGPFGSGTVFGAQVPPLAMIRSSVAFKETRTGELLDAVFRRIASGGAAPSEWTGPLLFVGNRVAVDDPRMQKVYSHFRKNLEDILQLGRECGAKILLSTVASNLKDCAPFASAHRMNLGSGELQQWEDSYRAGTNAESLGETANAISCYEKAGKLDPQFAEMQFRWARCCLALGDRREAARHFELARDYDTLRFRCDSRLNGIIRQSAADHSPDGVVLYDADKSLAEQSPDALPGQNIFYEHVHFNFHGNYLLALGMAQRLENLLPTFVAKTKSPPAWLTEAECARRLLWTDWNELQALNKLRLDVPPFTYRLNNAEQTRALRKRKEELSAALTTNALEKTVAEYRRAVAADPGDWVLQNNFALLLQGNGRMSDALKAWRRVAELVPQYAEAHLQLGVLLSLSGSTSEAADQFSAAFGLDGPAARNALTRILGDLATHLAADGNFPAAIQLDELALQFNPQLSEAHLDAGRALLRVGRTADAQRHFRMALKHPPGTPEALVALGSACAEQGWANEALTSFAAALRLDPQNVAAHFALGEELLRMNRNEEAISHLEQAHRLDPTNAEIEKALSAARH